jgi:hypothetical protein
MCFEDNHSFTWAGTTSDSKVPEGHICDCGQTVAHYTKCPCCGAEVSPVPTETAKARSRSLERMVRPLIGTSHQLWQRTVLGAWILRESHDTLCGCSYCREMGGTIGLALPECKARNSWRVLWWVRNGKLQVLRWTLPKWWPNGNAQP